MFGLRAMFKKRHKVFFVYSDRYRLAGSTIMRGKQLSDIIKSANHRLNIEFVEMDADFKDSTLLFTKGAMRLLSVDTLKNLKSKNNKIIFDPVDIPVDSDKLKYVDTLVAASATAMEYYKIEYPKTKISLVDHHVDPRVTQRSFITSFNQPKIAYFGELENTLQTTKINKEVDFHAVDTTKQDEEWFGHLNRYNIHYAIRSKRSDDYHKPFLKGITAAHCRSNVIVQASEEEALRWLGKDYPYLITGELNQQSILNMIEKIKTTYNKEEWFAGLDIMEEIKRRSSNNIIVDQFNRMIEDCLV